MKFLIIGLTSVFLFSCGQNGELSNTKKEENIKVEKSAETMKLSKSSGDRSHSNEIDEQTTYVDTHKTTVKKSYPQYDTGIRPTNSK